MSSTNLANGNEKNTLIIPRLEDYDISPITGFLPSIPPLHRLPDTYYERWENLIDSFHNLLSTGCLREHVKLLPILKTDKLKTSAEYQRAFLVLSTLAHGYVRGNYESPIDSIPACIAIPWVEVSDYLGVSPVVNHAAVVLWNWPIESFGGKASAAIISAIQAAHDKNHKQLIIALKIISSTIDEFTKILHRIYEKCDPYIFYWKIRPYVSGWENDESLPNGLKYEGVDGCDENGNPIYRQYVGGSAGQSSLIQSLDIVLNIEHYPTGIKPITTNNYNTHHSHNSSNGNLNNNNNASKNKRDLHQQQPYVYKIRQNIPGNHRRFLEDLTKVAIVRDYIMLCIGCNDSEINNKLESNRIFENNELVEAYNDCLDKMKTFRSKHLQIVSVYILAQAYIIDDSVTNGASTIKGNTINSSATNISAANSANDTIAKIATNDITTTNTTNWYVGNDPVANATTTANIKTNDVNKKIVNNKVTTTLAETSNDLNIVREFNSFCIRSNSVVLYLIKGIYLILVHAATIEQIIG
nr:9533_t:CDS:2 [Entrophospora candida]